MPQTPRIVGPHAVVEEVSESAFTVTYRAEQRGLGRTVLVKTLKPTVSAGSPFAAELTREAAVLGRFDHEGVVRLHDLVRAKDLIYLVLEDARAVPLDALEEALGKRGARLDAEVAAAVTLGAARALAHVHARGVVHRNLRPGAVAIAPGGRVIVGDFAYAYAASGGLDPIPEPVEAGEVLARPSSMAPEQILGEQAGPPADVWALGVLCHELCAGAHPFAADDPKEVARRIRSAPAAPLPPSVPPALGRAISRCLAKAPEDRFSDGAAAAAAFEEALSSFSRLPVPVLVSRALEAAGKGEALPAPGALAAAPRAKTVGIDVPRAARDLAVISALIVAGTVGLRLLDDPDAAPDEGVAETAPAGLVSHDRGLVRVVARPWAEVYVDGELVDTTPIGRPIPVAPGRHFVIFRHPAAPDEQRSIKISAGQSVFLDVTMRVDRGDAGPPRDSGAPPPSP